MSRGRGRWLLVGVLVAAVGVGATAVDSGQRAAFGASECEEPGSSLPVVVVHGFRSDAAEMEGLVAILEDTQIDVAVETFDYEPHASSWVTHEQIGPKLRERLICLADASLASGGAGRVAVVGHSMGGLAARYALSTDQGDGRGVLHEEIALVATIGTPHEGSLWGILAGQAERGLQNALTTQMWGRAQPIAGTPAGGALAVGSPQLAQLPDFPDGVPVLALASEYVGQSRFLLYRSPEAHVGDAVVSRSSALALSHEIDGMGGTDEITCRIDLPLELGIHSITAAVAAELYANPAVRDCGHVWQYDTHRLVGEINTHLAVAARQQPREIVSDEVTALIERWTDLHARCRGGPSDLETNIACNQRAEVQETLDSLGWCLGRRSDEPAADTGWHECDAGSVRAQDLGRYPTTEEGPATGSDEGSALVARWGPDGPGQPLGSDRADGSGCSPGTAQLPDGVWFGFIRELGDASVAFDLACLYTGERAYDHGAHSEGADIAMRNDIIDERQLPVSSDAAFFVHPAHGVDIGTYDRRRFEAAEMAALRDHLDQRMGLDLWSEAVGVWVLVEDGEMTEMLEFWYGFVS